MSDLKEKSPLVYSSLIFLAFAAIGTLIYSNTFQAGFQYDDWRIILRRSALANPWDFATLWSINPARFFTNISFAINRAFSGTDVFGYHVTNLLLHISASVVCYRLIQITFAAPKMQTERLTNHREAFALLAGLLFLCHPVQTQAVTYIVQRAASLATLFYLLTLFFYAHARLSEKKNFYILAFLSAVIAIHSKQTAYTLPFALMLYEHCFWKTGKRAAAQTKILLAFFLPVVATYFLSYHGHAKGGIAGVINVQSSLSHQDYFLTQFNVIRTYLRLLFVPIGQNLDYDYPIAHSLLEPATFLSFLLLAGLFGLGLKLFRRHRLAAFGIFWFFLTLSIESGLVNIADVIYEHRLYLPMTGFAVATLYALFYWIQSPRARAVIAVMALVGLSAATYQRNFVWQNELTLWQDVIVKSPEKARAHYALGSAYTNQMTHHDPKDENFEKAMFHYNKALERRPRWDRVYNNMANAYAFVGQLESALEYYGKAVQVKPGFQDALRNQKILQDILTKSPAAQRRFVESLQIAYQEPLKKGAAKPLEMKQLPVSGSITRDHFLSLPGRKQLSASPVSADGTPNERTIYSIRINLSDGKRAIAKPVNSDGTLMESTTYIIQ